MFAGHVIVTLDQDFIRNQFIPELAAKYFTSGKGLDYRVAITRRDDPEAQRREAGGSVRMVVAAVRAGRARRADVRPRRR